jgi:cysteinyl-tRNA synthetase
MNSTMDLKLYDTLTREKRFFSPLDPANVRMYVCGPTVYDFAHIGNARPVIVFDVLFRLLRHRYGADHVTYVRNITDVDDKINARAAEEYPALPLNEAIRKVTEQTDKQFHEDVAALGCLPPTVEPRATDHIAEMRAMIERLIQSGNAYVADDNVLFSVPSMADYGMLSKRPLDEMIAGARVEVAPYKRDPQDFILWKPSKPGEPAWPSPAHIKTPGRPGWHIECSAMSWRYLGEVFDIHGGGIDLVFPHHENEIAQSRCTFHTPGMANFWMHNGFLQVEGEKMSKSLGNFVTIRELLDRLPGDVVRLQMLMTHYRQPIDWTHRSSQLAMNELENWSDVLQGVYRFKNPHSPDQIVSSLADDLNTPNAIAVLRELHVDAENGGLDEKLIFAANCKFLGFQNLDKPGFFRFGVSAVNVGRHRLFDFEEPVQKLRAARANNASQSAIDGISRTIRAAGLDVEETKSGDITLIEGDPSKVKARIEELIESRTQARKEKNFKESDRIRDELAKMGVVLKDTKDGTTWEIAR